MKILGTWITFALAGFLLAATPACAAGAGTSGFVTVEGRHFELARFQALAAEAVLRGMGDDPAAEPPPMYAFARVV